MSNLATSDAPKISDPIYIKEVLYPSILQIDVNCVTTQEDWRTPVIKFIQGTLNTDDKQELGKITMKARNYCVLDGKLFRRALVELLLRSVVLDKSKTI